MQIKHYTKALLLLIAISIFSLPAYAQEGAIQTLTLNEAIKKAFSNSVTLRNDKLDVDTKEIQLDNAKQSVKYTPIDYNFNPNDTNVFKLYYGLDSEYRKAEKKLESDKRQLIIDVTTAYHKVIKEQNALEELKLTYAKDMIKHSQANSKFSVGLTTTADLLEAETQLVSTNAKIKEAEANLDNAYKELNKLIGQEINSRPKLEQVITFQPVEIDPDIEILKVLNNSYEMWQVEEIAKTAGITKYFEYWSDIGINTEAMANNKVADTKEQMKVSVAALCNGIKTLEITYNKLDQQVKQLEEKYRIIKLQHQVGLITLDNVLAVEEALTQAKSGKEKAASEHTLQLLTLRKLTGEL